MDFIAGILSTAVCCFTAPRQRVSAKREPDPDCFRLAREVLLRQFAKATLDAGTDVSLSGEQAGAAEVVAG